MGCGSSTAAPPATRAAKATANKTTAETDKVPPLFDAVEPKSHWDDIGATALKTALHNTQMIDAAWLARLADAGGILPRCQEVPSEAKVSLAEMERWQQEYTVGALIIS